MRYLALLTLSVPQNETKTEKCLTSKNNLGIHGYGVSFLIITAPLVIAKETNLERK
jgi:hypothetical protein